MNVISTLQCPICRAGLPDGALTGVCPACAWRDLGEPFQGEAPADPDVLFSIAGHDVIAEIARGGAGIVYRARQREPRREVALKMLLPQQLGSDEMRARFRLEAETIAALDHPAILPVYTVGEHGGLPFFTMKLATGGTLAARRDALARRWREIAGLMARLADAVHFAHTRGVIHRDVKPGNVLFDEAGGAYVSDFGLAKFTAMTEGPTRSINVLGTPAYLAPEVIERGAGSATTAGDVYGLGAIFYELLTGRVPFAADTLPALLREVTEGTPVDPSRIVAGIPRDLEVICLRCLAREPEQRLTSADALATDLRLWLADRPIQARPVSRFERTWRWGRRNPALANVSVLLGIALVGGGAALWASNRELRESLTQTRAAEVAAQEKLHQSLLAEARLMRQSRSVGQRVKTLETLAQAARISPTIAVRSEVAAALAKPDLVLGQRLPAFFPGTFSLVGYARDLRSYITPRPDGHFARLRVADGAELKRYRSPPGTAAMFFRFSDDDRHVQVSFSNTSSGIYAADGENPIWVAPAFEGNSLHYGLHPTGRSIAFGHTDGVVRSRDLSTGDERLVAPAGPRVIGVNFEPSGKRLLLVRYGRLDFLELDTGRLVWSFDTLSTGMRAAWSADGRLVAHGGGEFNAILVRNVETGKVLTSLSGHRTFPSFVEFLPDGKRLVSQAFDSTVRLWDLASGTEVLQARLPLRGLGVSPDGRQLGAAIDPDVPAIFTFEPEIVFREWRSGWGNEGARAGFHFSPDGRWLVTAESVRQRIDGQWETLIDVSLWDSARRADVGKFRLTAPSRDATEPITIYMAPDNQAILYSRLDWGVCRRRVQTSADGSVLIGDEERIPEGRGGLLLGFGANGRDWLFSRPAQNQIVVWPEGRPDAERLLMAVAPGTRVAVSPDCRWIVTMVSPKVEVHLRSIDDGTVKRVPVEREVRVQFSPDGQWLLTSNGDGHQTWRLPDLEPGPLLPCEPDGNRTRMAAFSPDGAWLATERARSVIDLWRTGSFAPVITLEPPLVLESSFLAWTPDGQRLAVLARGPRVIEWDLPALRRELAARGLDW